MKLLVVVILSLLHLISFVNTSRILAFVPFPSKSHQRVIQPLLKELALRGHNVTCYTAYPIDDPPDSYRTVKIDNYLDKYKKTSGANNWKVIHGFMESFFYPLFSILFKEFGISFTEWVFQQKQVQDLIMSDKEFDAVIMESSLFQDSFIALGHRFNAPVIEILPTSNVHWSYWLYGNPYDTSYIGDLGVNYNDRMTFSQRIMNTLVSCTTRLVVYYYSIPRYQRIMDDHLRYEGWESRPPLLDMFSNTSLVLVNTHFAVNYPYPYAAHVKEVGGLNIVPPKPLPKDLQKFMDNATDGVIYFSLGSSIGVSGMLGDKLRDIFSKVFSELKQKILWKWEIEFQDLPQNIKISKWFPQQDVLNHTNTRLMISHGGILSVLEAVNQGVPLLGIPLVGDGYRNIEAIKTHKCGISLKFDNITYDSLKWAIQELINNPMYRKNAKKRSQLYKDKPETALETAVFWTEYVIRHNGAHHLKPAIATMPWYQQSMIDIYIPIALIISLLLYMLYRIICCLCLTISKLEFKLVMTNYSTEEMLKKAR